MDPQGSFVRTRPHFKLAHAAVALAVCLAVGTGCSFDSGTTGEECSPDGKISEDGTRICKNGFWIDIDATAEADDIGPDATDDSGMDATNPPDTEEPDGGPTDTADDTSARDTSADTTPEDTSDDTTSTDTAGDTGAPDGDGGVGGDADGAGADAADGDACVPRTWYRDSDMDGVGTDSNSTMSCIQPTGYVTQKGDCNDGDDTIKPGASESCDGVDENCDGTTDEGLSQNCSKQKGVCSGSTVACQNGSYPTCDSSQYGSDYESPEQSCDGLDNDCDGMTDESVGPKNCSKQKGVCSGSTISCQNGSYPTCGASEYGTYYEANESSCDGRDNDCDGATDEGCTCVYDPTESLNIDRDGDHSYSICRGQTRNSNGVCQQPNGFEKQNPGESSCDGTDNDCDGSTDENITTSCYTGKSGTKGTGICSGGSGQCSNGSFPNCSDTIQQSDPGTAEVDCGNNKDDDCDATTDDCFYRKTDTSSTYDDSRVNDLAVDSSNGAVYVVGNGDPSQIGQDDEAFVAKYNKSGSRQWVSTLSSDGIDARGIALDPSNSRLYIAGEAVNSVDGNSVSGFADGFIAKYDLSGNLQDADTFGTTSTDRIRDITYDPTDNAIDVGGYTRGDIGGNTNAGGLDAFVIEYDNNFNRQWVAQFGTGENDVVEALDVDTNSGEVYAAGDTFDSLAPGANYQGSGGDVFLAKFQSQGSSGNGQRLWIKQDGSSDDEDVRGISVDAGGPAYVVGEAEGSFRSLSHSGDDDAFLLARKKGGSFDWFKSISTSQHDDYDAVRYDPDSSTVFAIGSSGGTPDATSLAGRYDVLVAAYSTSGSRNWVELRGTSEGDDGRAIGSSSNSSRLVIGGLWNRSNFSGDAFLERIQ